MVITCLIAKLIFGGYWLTIAPVLFLPLGAVLLSPGVLRGIFGKVVLLVAVLFAVFGVALVTTVPLRDAVRELAGIQAVWLLAAAITFVARRANFMAAQSLNPTPRRSNGFCTDGMANAPKATTGVSLSSSRRLMLLNLR